jgi:hypothetical protein
MRKVLLTLVLGCCLVGVAAAGDDGYGAALELEESTAIADILASPHEYEGKVVQVKGPVQEACTAKGCWMRIKSPDGQILLVKSSDETVLVPGDTAGRTAVVEGVVVIEHGDEPAESTEESGHTCAQAEIRLETRGVVLL